MKTILVTTDFSKNAVNAYKYALSLAKYTGAKIILLHVYETPVVFSEVPMATLQFDYAFLQKSAQTKLQKFYTKYADLSKGIKTELMLQQGLASARITEAAQEKKVDIIVMGTTGTNAVERFLIGSNTTRVINNAPCMVLAIPPKAQYRKINRIVFATDLSDENLEQAAQVSAFADIFKCELLFLYIDAKLKLSGDEDLNAVTEKIKEHVKYPKLSGYVCTDINVVNGIDYFLKHHKADCLAMLTHHRKFTQMLYGSSITKKVAYHTNIPLLAVHPADHL